MRGSGDKRFEVPLFVAIIGVFLLLADSAVANSFSYTTPDRIFAERMARYANDFAESHGGRPPSTWADFETAIGFPVDAEFLRLLPTKRYAILDPLPSDETIVLLLITRRPFRDLTLKSTTFGVEKGLRSPGRYIVYQAANGEFRTKYLDEGSVQRAFQEAGMELPAPDSEPLRQHEVEAHQRTVTRWTVTGAVASLAVIWYLFKSKRASRRSKGAAAGR